MLFKSTLREIKDSIGRYLAILMIVALGVGFICGLKVTTPAIVKSADVFYGAQNFHDFEIYTDLGINEDALKDYLDISGISDAELSVSMDVLCTGTDSDVVHKVMMLTDDIDKVSIVSGSLPEKDNECLADSRYYSEDDIGSYITISENNEDETIDVFKNSRYRITGICVSPSYVNYERGSTSLGNGTIDAFIYIPKSGFNDDCYSQILLTVEGDYRIYSDSYKDKIDSIEKTIESVSGLTAEKRYKHIKNIADEKISDAEKEYQDGLSSYLIEKNKAEKELSDAFDKLNDSEESIEAGKRELLKGKKKLQENSSKLKENESKITKGLAQIESEEKKLNDSKEEIIKGKEEIAETKSSLNEQISSLQTQLESINAALDGVIDDEMRSSLITQKSQIEGMLGQLGGTLEYINTNEQNLLQNEKAVDEGLEVIKGQKDALLTAKTELLKGKNELENARITLIKSEKKIESGEKELLEGWDKYNEGKNEAEAEFAKAEKKLSDAREKIDDAKADINDIDEPEAYVLSRNSNIGYVSFENDSSIVDQVARLFPIFFFLVAALVCMTTMTRMIDENRTQIGILRALGHSSYKVMGKYIFYCGSAGLIGSILGFVSCSICFPLIIWNAYGMMYEFTNPLSFVFDIQLGLLLLMASLICCIGTTVICGLKDFKETPAQLIRPKAPLLGKRILLERCPFIWSRLSFLFKVSIRNIFRYKKRFIMMVLGISGCTALLLTGFGAADSIKNVADYQYNDITVYDYGAYLDDDATVDDKRDLKNSEFVDKLIYVDEESVHFDNKGIDKTFTLVVSGDGENFNEYIKLYNESGKLSYPEDGYAIICENAAERNGISIGDTIKLSDDDGNEFSVTISELCKNYVGSYIYINDVTYEEITGNKAKLNTAYIISDDRSEKGINASSAAAWEKEYIKGTSVNQDMKERIFSLINNLDAVILLIVVAAGALCFIVLYNLTNINIMERIREIATLKVLGFYPMETASYVFRENIIMTAISAVTGLFLGKLLHAVIISMIKVDFIHFDIVIEPLSYLYAVILTFVFAVIVNIFMYFRLNKINMTESLKSVE